MPNADRAAYRTERETNALREAVNALYFADSADYGSALWSVVRAIDGSVADLLEEDEGAAFKLLNPDAEGDDDDDE